MPLKGRPRLTPEELDRRIAGYCQRYQAARAESGLPAFPTGKRETRQHREWIALYKAANRLGRRTRGQCERCSSPAVSGSVFCEEHRALNAGRDPNRGTPLAERRALLAAQGGRCPICAAEIVLGDSVEHGHETGGVRALLHAGCNRLAGLAESVGPEGLSRLKAFLWPEKRKAAKKAW